MYPALRFPTSRIPPVEDTSERSFFSIAAATDDLSRELSHALQDGRLHRVEQLRLRLKACAEILMALETVAMQGLNTLDKE